MEGLLITAAWVALFRRKISGLRAHGCIVVVISKEELGVCNHGGIGSGVSEEDWEGRWKLGLGEGVEIESVF